MTLPADPDAASPELLGRLGHEALDAGDAEQAVAAFGRAILLAPSDAALHADIAAAYLALGWNGEALGHAERAVRLAPGLAVAQHNLGNARFAHGDAEGALAAFRAARAIDPDSPAHWTNFLFTQVFTDADGDALFAENRAWGARLERRLGEIARPRPADVDPERPLRLAYFVPELDTHVTPRFVAPLLAHHDHAGIGPGRRDRLAIDALGFLGEEFDEGSAVGDFAAAFGQGLALLRRHDLGQVFLILHHQRVPLA